MAFTVVASWDFRGAGSDATKKASRIGSFTLVSQGSPSFSTDGVSFTASGDGLTIAPSPTELRLTHPFWIMVNFRRLGTVTNDAALVGLSHNNTDSDPYASLGINYGSSNAINLVGNNAGTFNAAMSSLTPVVDTDYSLTLVKKTSTAIAEGYDGASSIGSFAAAQPTYGASGEFYVGDYTGISRNSNSRVAWVLVGSGEISTSEMTTIQATPDSYLYPAGGGSSIAAISSYNTQRRNH